jgi:hypothetical protein
LQLLKDTSAFYNINQGLLAFRREVLMRKTILLFASAAVLFAIQAAAGPVAPTAATAAPASAPMVANDPTKIVCRNLAAKTGSHIGASRECRTQKEWDDIRHQDEREIEKMQTRDNLAPH